MKNAKKIEVSMIIPVYNVEKYLRQCLNSVISQPLQNIEIIILNDCSTDSSYKIIMEYQKKDDRIIVVNSLKNAGLGNTRNTGLKIATGKYIVFIDSDDWITKDYLEVLYNNIEKYNCDFLCASFYDYNNQSKTMTSVTISNNYCNIVLKSQKDKQYFLSLNLYSVWRSIYNRDFLIRNNIYFKTSTMEDSCFIWQVVLASSSFMLIDKPIYYYRKNRKHSITAAIRNESDIIKSYEQIKQILIDKKCIRTYKHLLLVFSMTQIISLFLRARLTYKQLLNISYKLKQKTFKHNNIDLYIKICKKIKIAEDLKKL